MGRAAEESGRTKETEKENMKKGLIIALCALLMAYLYHSNGYSAGYTAGDIKAVGTELGITKISALEEAKLSAFMEELKELNVLRSTDASHYLFTRVTFFQMMGTSTEVDDKLEPYMGV